MIETFVEFAQAIENDEEVQWFNRIARQWIAQDLEDLDINFVLDAIKEERLRIKPKPKTITCYMYKDNSCPDKVYVLSRNKANCSIIDTWEREIPS